MAIRVALNHKTVYTYDRPISLSPHIVRLRPAPHCRTQILSYSLNVRPRDHFENWQQDPHGNFLARLVFPNKLTAFEVEVDLVAEMSVINPFDFFVESSAESFPFVYEPWLARELRPFLEVEPAGPLLTKYLDSLDRGPTNTVTMLVALNARLQSEVSYLIRMEPGVQATEETLANRSGSCRDTAWLLVQILRHLGLAARFASGYLIQLAPDLKPLNGPPGPARDFTDLHAWAEVYLPGAGWIGLDATSGLLAAEGHLPLACTPDPSGAAPISGLVESSESSFDFSMSVTRIHETPRVTRPYSDEQWQQILALGQQVDQRLVHGDVRLTMGGEPTFVSIDDMDGAEWTVAAVGPAKRRLAGELIRKLHEHFAPGGVLHYGQGKWYPGEPLPRWALTSMWRTDGQPLWRDPQWFAGETSARNCGLAEAEMFTQQLARRLSVEPRWVMPAYEDVWQVLAKERRLPVNVDLHDSKLKDAEERSRLARIMESGLGQPAGYVLPLRRQWWQGRAQWTSGPWPVRTRYLFLLPGDSPLGLRLPLDSLPWTPPSSMPSFFEVDPLAPRDPLPSRLMGQTRTASRPGTPRPQAVRQQRLVNDGDVAPRCAWNRAADNCTRFCRPWNVWRITSTWWRPSKTRRPQCRRRSYWKDTCRPSMPACGRSK
jgi:transglutaminase-like putative cysteine protease